MKTITTTLIACALAASSGTALAENAPVIDANAPILSGIDSEQAAKVLARLQSAQDAVRDGSSTPFPFTLTSGSSILSDSIEKSPRENFLALELDAVSRIKRKTDLPTVLSVYDVSMPSGSEETGLFWRARVWINVSGHIERIDMEKVLPDPL